MTVATLLIALFWAQVLLTVGNGLLLRTWIRRRRWGQATISGGCFVLSAAMAGVCWWLEGSCVLPHPALIPYEAGMSLCPGQATIIRLPAPPAARDL